MLATYLSHLEGVLSGLGNGYDIDDLSLRGSHILGEDVDREGQLVLFRVLGNK